MGAHSTGKTTFMRQAEGELRAFDHQVTHVPDLGLECRSAGFGILRDHTFASTLWIMTTGIKAELEAELTADVILVDRAVPDALAYLEAALETQSRCVSCGERKYLYDLARMHAARYSLLIRTTVDTSIAVAVGRDPDMSFRALVDA